MSLSILSEPRDLLPVYTPVAYRIKTDRYPNTIPGESNRSIVSIAYPTSTQLAANTVLESTDILVQHSAFASGTLAAGDRVIMRTTDGLYDGIHVVRKVVTTGLTVIDADYLGDDTGGVMSKYYNKLTLRCVVTINGVEDPEPYDVGFDASGEAKFDIRTRLQRAMDSTLDTLDSGGFSEGLTSHHVRYSVAFHEGYMIPTRGVPTFFDNLDSEVRSSTKTGVMAAQPYTHTLAGQQYQYGEYLVDFRVFDVLLGARFLTHMPRGVEIPIGRDEFARLDYLLGKSIAFSSPADMVLRVVAYSGAGLLVASNDIAISGNGQTTRFIQCGPRNFSSLYIPSTATKYTVQLVGASSVYSEKLTFRIITRRCEEWVRFHWRNKVGGFDSFAFDGPIVHVGETESIITEREALDDYTFGDVAQLKKVRSKKSSELVTAQTSYISAEFQQWLAQDLCTSLEVYITTSAFDQYVPVIIEDGEVPPFTEKGDRAPFQVSYRLASEMPSHVR